ncbi:uncharacterized protein knl1 isoform X2 [Scophthalmus maximus]|uniref:uncharacterized protein knl1 isoform X2 n=1 Tax=Scophthalmus maximus TaxID=52904 RepID=UPI001FA8460C|nr:uncharacterized protein knl1 isoform X2 [Scophthalmus maximus]
MEPQEFAKNDESGGFSKRRISSILKAPRKSARFPDPEQQENVKVESCVKPVEKRNSRRVSFAPANDVLLFSKDVKNTSPGRSPLQELMTATGATTQNRIPAAVAEDGIQQLKAMETLLNAPLHACKQDTVNFETVEGFGEKTVVFSTDDAFMDMTHSHSINFATYADISLHNCDALPTGREKTVVFAADDASMDLTLNHTINTANKDLSVEKRNVSSSVPSVDPGFENFLASLFKPGGPPSSSTAETSSSLAHIKTQKTERVDKENWLPTSVSAAMDKSVGEFRKTGQSSHGSALCPEEDVSMNLTEVHTGRILGVNEDENPFHFLFPTQDMYAQADKRLSQTAEMGKSKSDHKAATTENRVQKVNIEYRSGPVKDAASLKNPSQNASHPRRKVNFDARDERTEKTIMFSADDEFMDMTQSHTVNIARGPLAPQQESAGGLDLGFKNFLTGLSKPTGPGVKPVIERMLPSAAASSKETITTSSSSSQLKTSKADPGKDNRSPNTSQRFGQSSTAGGICPEVDVGMDLTEAQTGRIIGIAGSDDPFQFLFHTQDLYPHGGGLNKTEKTSGQKNSEALGSSNRTGMGSSLKPSLKTKLQSHQDHFDPEDDHREKTVRFSADDACMDVTRSYTVNIGNDLKLLSCRDKTMRFNVDDAGMDMTQCLTVNIANNLGSESILPVWEQENETRGPTPRGRSSSAHGLAPEFKSMPTSGPGVDPAIARKTLTAAPSSDVRDSSGVGSVCPEDDVSMDMEMTEAQTGRILGITHADDSLQCLSPTPDVYPHSGGLNKAYTTSGQKNSEALGSSNRTGMGSSLKPSLKTKLQSHQDNFDPEDDQREKTVRFSADDACMDVTRSYTVNIGNDLKLLSCRDKTMRFNVDDAGMDMTQCLTVNIANNLGSESILPVWEQESETCGPTPRGRSSSAQGLAPEFKSMPTSGPGVDPAIAIKKPTAVPSSDVRDSSGVGSVCPKDDVSMDMEMTEAQTGRILGITHADDSLQCLFPTPDVYPHSGGLNKAYTTSGQKNSEALGSSNRTGMGSSLKPSLKTKLQSHQDHFDPEDDHREKTVRFSADDACMDVTRSYTVNIGNDLKLLSCTDKTMRFNVDDAGMDMTQCLTVNIANNLGSESILPVWEQESETRGPTPRGRSSSAQGLAPEFKSLLTSNSGGLRCQDPEIARKTLTAAPSSDVRDSSGVGSICPEDDVSMDMEMTEAQTGRILGITHADDSLQFPTQDLYPHSGSLKRAEMASLLPSSEVSGLSDCKGMDKSFQTSLNTAMEKQQVKFDAEVDCREETVKLSTDEAATNVTAGFTVNVASKSVSASFLPHQESNIVPTQRDAGFPFTVKKGERSRSLSARSLDTGFKTSLSRKSCPWANPMITKAVAAAAAAAAQCPLEGVGAKGHREQLRAQRPDVDTEDAAPGFVPTAIEKSQNKTMTEINMSMDMTEAQTGHIFGQTYTDELPQCFPPTHDSDPEFDLSKRMEATSQRSDEAPGPSNQVANFPGYVDSDEIVTGKEPEPRNESKMESPRSTVDQDPETLGSRKLRRLSLADLQSKARRLSRLINTAPDTLATESCAPPLAQLEDDDDLDQTSKDKNKSPEPELATGSENTRDDTQARCLARGGEASAATTPFKLKTKQLMSRLSVGSFKPKLPQRNKPNQPKTGNCAGEHTRTMTVNVTNQLSNFDDDVSDIYDEELGSLEEETEMVDAKSPRRVTEKVSRAPEADEPLEEEELEEDLIGAVHGRKRPLPEDENNTEDEKRMRAERSTDVAEMSHFVECDITAAPTVTAHASDCSSSIHTASVRCEATFESTFKQSLFESQLEDYASDVQKKLDDGTITVLEFFNLFNIDFVIHNPRQSVLPGRRLSDTDCTTMDVLKDRHISRPKQTVYETDVLNLTEKVEGLKVRMQDLDKPLKMVNKPLWEEIRNCSERELKSFGASLKERNNFFRKTSKAQSHEMKEVLYSNIVQANLEEQQKLRGTIEEADEMIKSLDDCICELEAELAAVGEKGFLDKPSLKSRQEEMKNVTESLADTERQTIEVELQKKHNSSKLNRLKAETRNLESHVTVLQMVNEWRFGEQSDNCTVYTFLHDTLHLQLVYKKSKGTDADNQSERKISHINFKLQLDDEKSQFHARLVHQLLSGYIEGETPWVEKYPTSRHVPKLLHDVGLVVSRCRLLGEELRLLKLWGGLRLDILDISCVDTRLHVVFSRLKTLSKFEVVFSVSLIDRLCVVEVESFHNVMGNTTIQQIKEIVASFSPAKNLVTKIVKKIHHDLLC